MYVCQHPRSDCITFRPKLADFAGAERNDVATHTELKTILKCATFMNRYYHLPYWQIGIIFHIFITRWYIYIRILCFLKCTFFISNVFTVNNPQLLKKSAQFTPHHSTYNFLNHICDAVNLLTIRKGFFFYLIAMVLEAELCKPST